MRILSNSPIFPRVVAALVAGAMAATTLLPAARAQAPAAPAAAAPTYAQKAEARKAYQAGQKSYNADDFAAAAESFKKADATVPSPHAKYWYAASLDKSDPEDAQLADKIAAYEAYLAEEDAAKVGEDVLEQAKSRLAELKAKAPGTVKLTTVPEGATVTVDGAAQGGATPLDVTLAPGAHKIVVAAEGYVQKELDVMVEGSQTLEQSIQLEAEPPPETPAVEPPPEPEAPPPPPPPPPAPSKVPAYVTLGIAGVGAIVGTTFGVMALNKKSDFNDHPTSDTADAVERNALISDMAFGVAITLGVTGVVLLTSKEEATAKRLLPKQARLHVAPYVSPEGGGAAARLTF